MILLNIMLYSNLGMNDKIKDASSTLVFPKLQLIKLVKIIICKKIIEEFLIIMNCCSNSAK